MNNFIFRKKKLLFECWLFLFLIYSELKSLVLISVSVFYFIFCKFFFFVYFIIIMMMTTTKEIVNERLSLDDTFCLCKPKFISTSLVFGFLWTFLYLTSFYHYPISFVVAQKLGNNDLRYRRCVRYLIYVSCQY